MKHKSSRIMLFVLLSVLFLGMTFVYADTAEEYFNRGLANDKQGNWSEAISNYTNAIKINPNFAVAYFNRGNAYYNNGNYDLAISDYTKATGINPNLPQAYNNRGGAYINKGNNDQAILDCSKAIALYPNYADAFNNRGTAYYHKKEYDKAWADVNKAEKLGASVDPQFLKDLKKASGRDNYMAKICKKCKVPLEGFLYWLIASKIFGLRPSTTDPELCNKCEDKKGTLWPTQTQ